MEKFATRENLFDLLEGNGYKEPALIALALADSNIICTGQTPKAVYRFIREFVEDVIFPDIEEKTGTIIDSLVLDDEAADQMLTDTAKRWFKTYNQEGLPDETLANFVELLKTYCE